jgi:predicted NAD-dependent protein-ADP-ribosyltransferase YbiA (DUF1768 family)
MVAIGKAIDIWSTKPYPANILSNLHSNSFEIDGVKCASMEGFLQSLKITDFQEQSEICALSGLEAKARSTSEWQLTQNVYWQGRIMHRQSQEFQDLIFRAYELLFQQNEVFREALLATRGKKLYHVRGVSDPRKTILTEKEFCTSLIRIRDAI